MSIKHTRSWPIKIIVYFYFKNIPWGSSTIFSKDKYDTKITANIVLVEYFFLLLQSSRPVLFFSELFLSMPGLFRGIQLRNSSSKEENGLLSTRGQVPLFITDNTLLSYWFFPCMGMNGSWKWRGNKPQPLSESKSYNTST